LRLRAVIALGAMTMAARRSDLSRYGCRRGFYPGAGTSVAFLGTGTSTLGRQFFPASFATPSPTRWLALLSDTSAKTYVFDQDLTDMTERYGAGINIPCGVYATQGNAFCVDDCAEGWDFHSQSANFVALCGVPLGTNHRMACQGRRCPTCTLLAPPECFVRNAERINYVRQNTLEAPLPLQSAEIPWDFGPNEDAQSFVMAMDEAGMNVWPHPIRSIRSYDTGACRIEIAWPRLASLVNEAFLQVFLNELRDNSRIERIFHAEVRGWAGPQLRGNSVAAFDEVFLHNEVHGYVQARLLLGLGQRHLSGTVSTRFSLEVGANTAGFARVMVPYVTAWSTHLPTTPWEVGEAFAKKLPAPEMFPKIFTEAFRNALLIPSLSSNGTPVVTCSMASDPPEGSPPAEQGVTECLSNLEAPDFVGPERGCYPRSAYAKEWSALFALSPNATAPGICGTRLQPHRVNLLPHALQIVVVNRGTQDNHPRDDMATFVTRLSQDTFLSRLFSTAGFTLECDATRPTTPPTSRHHHLVNAQPVRWQQGDTRRCGVSGSPPCEPIR
jgi:hypothetical protein